jgi:simple sugar transport system ATP-binding protein
MLNITKHFGALAANDGVTFSVEKGCIHALVGENGAGKSTLMNLLYGLHQPESGEIRINGTPQLIPTAARAIKLGIGMVHQHFMLVPTFSVAENTLLGNEPVSRFGIFDSAVANKSVRELSDRYHFNLNPGDNVGALSIGAQQRVEILKLLYRNAEIIILDEPTAVLTPQEVEDFFAILRKLTREGKTVIFISHKVSEILSISDSVTVMRKGKVVGEVKTAETTGDELSRMMVGREVGRTFVKSGSPVGGTLLKIENLSCESARRSASLKNVSLYVDAGEVLGIAAVEGNGQTELVEILTGLREPSSGSFFIDGLPALAHIPEDRLKYGLVLDFTLDENFILGRQREPLFASPWGLNRLTMASYSREQVSKYQIATQSGSSKAKELSGGNQQKVVVARELSKNARVIIACHPSRGLDVGATEFVHHALLQERNSGNAVLVVSSDLTELLTLSDRIAVLFNGTVMAVLNAYKTSERELGLYMTGAI